MSSLCTRRLFATTKFLAKDSWLKPAHHNPSVKFDRRATVVDRRGRRAERAAAAEAVTVSAAANTEREPAPTVPRDEAPEASDDSAPSTRLPKRRCAIMMGYSGAGYHGMQYHMNDPHLVTIEWTLWQALITCGLVAFQRAARTDKGVSALGNVVSASLTIKPGMVQELNAVLPPSIRVWDVVRTLGRFNSHVYCSARRYCYFFPTFVLRPPAPGTALYSMMHGLPHASPVSWAETQMVEDPERLDYRVTPEVMQRLRNLSRWMTGNKRFHNFAPDILPTERSANRQIYDINFSEPFLRGGVEWVKMSIHGASFMMHQIRKMMGALFLFTRTETPSVVLRALMHPRALRRSHVPRAPAAGLMLEQTEYGGYNKKVCAAVERDSQPTKVATRFLEFDQHQDAMEQLRKEQIWPRVQESEQSYSTWTQVIDAYDGQDLCYVGPRAGARPDDPPLSNVEESMLAKTEINDEDHYVNSVVTHLPDRGGRVRITYAGHGVAVIPTHGKGIGFHRNKFSDFMVDNIWQGRASKYPIIEGEDAALEAKLTSDEVKGNDLQNSDGVMQRRLRN
ncbi:pseudouridine synthase [Auriculariales sp. MPI-PUGE-AT-0066]|nr:pseudouridine synthase [Auriculariales sp. MPI-PUGE-AT-0066]